MKKAVILLSGGLDSAVSCAIAKAQGFEVYALSFFYGQRHEVELISAKKLANFFGAKEHKIAEIDLRIFGNSALTAEIAVPKDREELGFSRTCSKSRFGESDMQRFQEPRTKMYKDIHRESGKIENAIEMAAKGRDFEQVLGQNSPQSHIPITYVPARNTIFLAYSLAFAEVIEAFDIFIGVNSIDYSGYPDCRPEFIRSFETMANLATAASTAKNSESSNGGKFKIHTPLGKLSKKEIIAKGIELGVDFGLTHSCYDPVFAGDKVLACGHCDSCLLRLEGFRALGRVDAIGYVKS